jgi:hypothetical protein
VGGLAVDAECNRNSVRPDLAPCPVPLTTPSSKCPCTSPATMLVPTTHQTNTLLQFGNFNDPAPATASTTDYTQPPQRFPHIRAQLAAIARQHKETSEIEIDDETGARIPADFVHKVVEFLDNEHEDQLKALLTETYPSMDSESVSAGITRFNCPRP